MNDKIRTNWVEYTIFTRGSKQVNFIYINEDEFGEMPFDDAPDDQDYSDSLGQYILDTQERWANHAESVHMDFKFHVIPPLEVLTGRIEGEQGAILGSIKSIGRLMDMIHEHYKVDPDAIA